MTSRGMYEAVLIELHKENAPNILLEDFNYFANKAINQYINKRYNIYDINQQTTDDLRVLKATAMLPVVKINDYEGLSLANNATYEVIMPQDYLHILNCICIYDVAKTYKCYNKGDTWRAAATRLTADAYSQVLDNFWNKPSYKRPYYYIHNVNYPNDAIFQSTNPVRWNFPSNSGTEGKDEIVITITNPDEETGKYHYLEKKGTWDSERNEFTNYESIIDEDRYTNKTGTDSNELKTKSFIKGTEESGEEFGEDGHGNKIASGNRIGTSILLNNGERIDGYSNVERGAQIRYGNVSQVRLEIRYGTDDSIFKLTKVYVDYIKAPQNIRLTQEEVDYTEDRSQMLEFPDYVCQEIINELVHLIMENISEQRLQTHPIVTQSIANPAQQQTEPVAQAT